MNKPQEAGLFINFRFALIFFVSVVLMLFDVKLKMLSDFRYYLESALYPVLVFADSPRSITNAVSVQFKSRSDLLKENEILSALIYEQKAQLLRLKSLELENDSMRKLLNSPLQEDSKRIFAKVINVDTDPSLNRIVVNRGTDNGIFVGMPVITDIGLVGQVIETNYGFSRVLQVIDPSSSIPVMNVRTQVRAIAQGMGSHDELLITNIPRETDMQEGDMLVTSGLGGVYPEGYPVAIVTKPTTSRDYDGVVFLARPIVEFDKIRYVLMLNYKAAEKDIVVEIPPKQRTDDKIMLREQKAKNDLKELQKNKAQ